MQEKSGCFFLNTVYIPENFNPLRREQQRQRQTVGQTDRQQTDTHTHTHKFICVCVSSLRGRPMP